MPANGRWDLILILKVTGHGKIKIYFEFKS